jgi:primosomal protein N' (replication factor Y)
MTYHYQAKRLICHHCEAQKTISSHCEQCNAEELIPVGLGTERLEEVLKKYFNNVSIARIDRDSTQRKGTMENVLRDIHAGHHRILIGTQMLAKGHHFPNVTLVAIVDADGGFFSNDFRSLERMGQVILQVAGRAGREEKKGKVLIQTHHPDHPLLYQLIREGYSVFARSLLDERKEAGLPPYSFFALFRAEAHLFSRAEDFLKEIKALFLKENKKLHLLGPIPASMPRKKGKHRLQLLIQSGARPLLQQVLRKILPDIEKIPLKHRVRWSLDVDPLEMM